MTPAHSPGKSPEERARISQGVTESWTNRNVRSLRQQGLLGRHVPGRKLTFIAKVHVVQQHLALYHLREWLLLERQAAPEDFAAYDALNVKPQHVHRSKYKHLAAATTLLQALDNIASQRVQRLRAPDPNQSKLPEANPA